MEYQVLKLNDNDTATVEIDIDGQKLNQDFPIGADLNEFQENVKTGLAVFSEAIQRNKAKEESKPDHVSVGLIFSVDEATLEVTEVKTRSTETEPAEEVEANAEIKG